MARLTIYKDNDTDSTVISNLFIDEYMKDANDAQLKVYLYLLRMMNAHKATSIADIADKFNHTEKDVIRSLKYWEKQQLLDLDFDEDDNLVGIHIREFPPEELTGKKPVQPASFIPMPVSSPVQSMSGFSSGTIAQLPKKEIQPASSMEKPVYSADEIRAFRDSEDTAQLLFIAESYIGKPLTPSEVKSILFFKDKLHFSDDLVDYLLQYCVERGKKSFRYIEKVAINWADEGITTPKQAQDASACYDRNVYSIMKALGKNSTPTETELEFISRWTMEYAFSPDIIFEACERTVLATDKNRFNYADEILRSWKEQNVHHKADIAQLDHTYKQRRKTVPTGTVSQSGSNRFNQFAQNSYDFDALEKELLSN